MQLIVFFLAILATYRIAYFVPFEDGPFNFMERTRSYFTNKTYNIEIEANVTESGEFEVSRYDALFMTIDDMISCPYCVGFWVSLIVAPIALYTPVVLLPFAIAGGAHLIERLMQAWEGE